MTTYIPGPGEDGYAMRDEESAAEALGYPPVPRERSDQDNELAYQDDPTDMTEHDPCIDPECDVPWNGHSREEVERCLAYAMYEALSDPVDAAELQDEEAAGFPVYNEAGRRERLFQEVRRVLFPEPHHAEAER